MTQIKIEICIDNDAFQVGQNPSNTTAIAVMRARTELRRIFAQIDERIGDLAENGAIRLMDRNGNSVGTARADE